MCQRRRGKRGQGGREKKIRPGTPQTLRCEKDAVYIVSAPPAPRSKRASHFTTGRIQTSATAARMPRCMCPWQNWAAGLHRRAARLSNPRDVRSTLLNSSSSLSDCRNGPSSTVFTMQECPVQANRVSPLATQALARTHVGGTWLGKTGCCVQADACDSHHAELCEVSHRRVRLPRIACREKLSRVLTLWQAKIDQPFGHMLRAFHPSVVSVGARCCQLQSV